MLSLTLFKESQSAIVNWGTSVLSGIWRTLSLSQHQILPTYLEADCQYFRTPLLLFDNEARHLIYVRLSAPDSPVFFQGAILSSVLYIWVHWGGGCLIQILCFWQNQALKPALLLGYKNALPTRLWCLLTRVYYAQLIPVKSVSEFSTGSLSSRDMGFFSALCFRKHILFWLLVVSIRSSHGLILMFAALLTQSEARISETSFALYILSAV